MMNQDTLQRIRAAIRDRATWFALLYAEWEPLLGADQLEAAARKAVLRYGRYKGAKDPAPFGTRELLEGFRDGGGAALFDAEIELHTCSCDGAVRGENHVRHCALVEAWRELGLPRERIEFFCDIAMEGDRGRAGYHGIRLTLDETLAHGDPFCRIGLADPGADAAGAPDAGSGTTSAPRPAADPSPGNDPDAVERIRSAVRDRAVWFAFLYEEVERLLPPDRIESAARKAIFAFGGRKAKGDPTDFCARAWVERHVSKGSAAVFDSVIEVLPGRAVQRMRKCPLVEAWEELGLSRDRVALFCDIAMEGDRGRAAAHGIRMELAETLGKGDCFCHLVVHDREE